MSKIFCVKVRRLICTVILTFLSIAVYDIYLELNKVDFKLNAVLVFSPLFNLFILGIFIIVIMSVIAVSIIDDENPLSILTAR